MDEQAAQWNMELAHSVVPTAWRNEAAREYRRWIINILKAPEHKVEMADCLATMNLIISENHNAIAFSYRQGKLTKNRMIAAMVDAAKRQHQRK